MAIENIGLYPISIDVYKKHKESTIYANDNDLNSRGLLITLLKNDAAFDSTGISLKIGFRNAVGEERLYDCELVDATQGQYKVFYPTEMLTGNGGRVVKVEIKAYEGSGALLNYSPIFVYVNASEVPDDALEGTNEGSVLLKAIAEYEAIGDEYLAAEALRDSDYDSAEAARDISYTTKEQGRDTSYGTAEASRNTAYGTEEGIRNTQYASSETDRDNLYATAEANRDSQYAVAEAGRDTLLNDVDTRLDELDYTLYFADTLNYNGINESMLVNATISDQYKFVATQTGGGIAIPNAIPNTGTMFVFADINKGSSGVRIRLDDEIVAEHTGTGWEYISGFATRRWDGQGTLYIEDTSNDLPSGVAVYKLVIIDTDLVFNPLEFLYPTAEELHELVLNIYYQSDVGIISGRGDVGQFSSVGWAQSMKRIRDVDERVDVAEADIAALEAETLDLETNKVDKIVGKQLSTEDYTTAEKTKVANVPENTNDELSGINAQLADIETDIIDLQARAIRQYGVRRTLNATSPLLERMFDAAGKVVNVPTDDGAAVNDFDNIFPWSHIRECKRDSTGRIQYKGDPGYDLLTNVDWLIEIPKFYIRMQRTATTFDRVISEIKRAGFWVPSVFKRADGTECDKIYVGRFKTGIVDGVDVSRPGTFPENFRDLASFRTGARAKGAGWQLIDISYKTEVLDMLYIIESATLNSQVYLGNGITTVIYVATDLAQIAETAVNRIVVTNAMAGNYNVGENICIGTAQGSEDIARDRTILSKAALPDGVNTEIVFDGDPVNIAVGNVLWQGAQKNGQTVNLQKPNGKLSGVSGRTSNKYRGMEDIFGNVYEWVDGVLINDLVAQICKNPAKYASTLTADYKPVGYTNLDINTYPLEMGFDSNYPEAIFPTTTGGGTSTGYCDYYYQNTGLRGAFFGGAAAYGSSAGVFYWNLSYAPTLANWNIGSRLLFKPPV